MTASDQEALRHTLDQMQVSLQFSLEQLQVITGADAVLFTLLNETTQTVVISSKPSYVAAGPMPLANSVCRVAFDAGRERIDDPDCVEIVDCSGHAGCCNTQLVADGTIGYYLGVQPCCP